MGDECNPEDELNEDEELTDVNGNPTVKGMEIGTGEDEKDITSTNIFPSTNNRLGCEFPSEGWYGRW